MTSLNKLEWLHYWLGARFVGSPAPCRAACRPKLARSAGQIDGAEVEVEVRVGVEPSARLEAKASAKANAKAEAEAEGDTHSEPRAYWSLVCRCNARSLVSQMSPPAGRSTALRPQAEVALRQRTRRRI